MRVETEGKRSSVALGWIPDEGSTVTLIEGVQVEDLIAVLLVDGAVEVAVEAAMQKIRLVVMADGSLVAR